MLLSLSSVFRQSGQRDDRRRRLLAEDATGFGVNPSAAVSTDDASPSPKPNHYGNAEFLAELPRLIDFLPRNLVVIFLVEMLGLAGLAGLVGLHFWSLEHPALFRESGWNAFNLSQHGGLGTWISALCLLAASFTALAIYSVRRHRADDYQGRYRIWLWATVGLFLFATDLSAGLHPFFQHLLVQWTGTPLWRGGELWWIIPAALLFAALGSRVLVDMWPCRLAMASLAAGAAVYAISLLAGLQILVGDDPLQQVLLPRGTALLGHFFLLMGLLYQARYVRLDAEGLIRRRPRESKPGEETPEAESADTSDAFVRVDSPQGVPQPVLRRAAPAPQSAPIAAVQRKLTKQEKKALRERLLRERLKREGKW
jgi:hypothetical protein